MLYKRIVLASYLLLTQLAFSHGGGLNSQGCHNEKRTDGYHCHRAKNAIHNTGKRSTSPGYNRSDFDYRSYRTSATVGYYTGQTCSTMNVDHVVSLKDAHESGARTWPARKKSLFANDRENHVPSCRKINISKGSAVPQDFFRRSRDGKGLDYELVNFCGYVKKYYSIKKKYELSFLSNNERVFASCGVDV